MQSEVREGGMDRRGKSSPLPSHVHSLGAGDLTDKIQIDSRKSLFVWELTKEVAPLLVQVRALHT